MATIYQRGRAWYLNWSEGGRQHRKSLGAVSRAEARKAKAIKEAELVAHIRIFSYAPLFTDYAQEYLEWYEYEHPASYPRTEQIIRCHLTPAFEHCALDQLDARLVETYKSRRLQSTAKAETVAKEIRTLKAMLNRAVEWGVIDVNPCPHVKAPKAVDSKPPRFYTADELQRLYQTSGRWIWQLMANTGLRRSEALMLRREWDMGDRLRILSSADARTKSGKWREVPVSPGARAALDHLQGEKGYILPRMHPRSLSRKFETALRHADLDGNLHCLRHTFCSHLVMRGVPLRTVQVLAGHSTFAVTEKYAHLAPDHLSDALAGLDL